jgi:hypothetical protein
MVGTDDPFRPRKVLDGLAEVGELPVENGGDSRGVGQVEQHVLWTEVAVDEHIAVTGDPSDGVYWQRLERAEGGTDQSHDETSVAFIEQLLTMSAGQLAHHDARWCAVELEHLGHRQVLPEI